MNIFKLRAMIIRGGVLALLGATLLVPVASAVQCKKGKPCGNSCIAKDKVCHKDSGSAAASGEPTPAAAKKHKKQKAQ